MGDVMNFKMLPFIEIAGCDVVSRPMGELATTVGDMNDMLIHGYTKIPGLQGAPILCGNLAANQYGIAAGVTATDLAAVVTITQTRRENLMIDPQVWGLKHDVRYGNNAASANFNAVVTPIFRDIVTNELIADEAARQTFIITPNLGANSSLEFFTFTSRPALALTYDNPAAAFTGSAIQGSYCANPWALRTLLRGGAPAADAAVAAPFYSTLRYEAIVIAYQNQSTVTQNSSVTPIFGCIDSVRVFRDLLNVL